MEGLISTGFNDGDTLPQMKYVFTPEKNNHFISYNYYLAEAAGEL